MASDTSGVGDEVRLFSYWEQKKVCTDACLCVRACVRLVLCVCVRAYMHRIQFGVDNNVEYSVHHSASMFSGPNPL